MLLVSVSMHARRRVLAHDRLVCPYVKVYLSMKTIHDSLEQMVPDDVLMKLVEIGHAAKSAGMLNHAERLFQHLCHAYPLRTFPHMGLALVCVQKKLYARACEEFEEVIALGGRGVDLYLWYGICNYECERYAKAYEALCMVVNDVSSCDSSEVSSIAIEIMKSPRMALFSSR